MQRERRVLFYSQQLSAMLMDVDPLKACEEINPAPKSFVCGFFRCPQPTQGIQVVSKPIDNRLIHRANEPSSGPFQSSVCGLHVDSNGMVASRGQCPTTAMGQAAKTVTHTGSPCSLSLRHWPAFLL